MNLATMLSRNLDLDFLTDIDFYPNKMTTTYDKSGGNSDGGDYLRYEEDRPVLCDIEGPGAIVRFYVARSGGTLRFFFDGEKTPRLEINCVKFFSGETYPFVSPLVGPRGLGYYCYVPMPFQNGCRIECQPAEDGTMAVYCQVTHVEFPEGTKVKTFEPEFDEEEKAALELAVSTWNNSGAPPQGARPGQETVEIKKTLPANEAVIFSQIEGSGVIDALYLKLNSENTDLLRQILIRIYWDGLIRPGVDSPIGDFFGNAFEFRPYNALLTGLSEEGEYYCYFPMPFADSAQIELVNDSGERIENVEMRLVCRKTERPGENIGRFHAKWRREYTMEVDMFHTNLSGRYNYTILDATGQGKYCGCSMSMVNNWARWWGEGDEMIFVDGDEWPPAHHGTGTEEYFNDAWGFHDGICPVSAAMLAGPLEGPSGLRCFGPNALLTHHIINALPFSKSIRVTLEHGTENDKSNDYASTAYWYQKVPGQDFFVMPRVSERMLPGKEKWIEHYALHRQELVRDRLGKVRKFMQMFEDHPTTAINIEERRRSLMWWQYFMRIVSMHVFPNRNELIQSLNESRDLPLEGQIEEVEKWHKKFRASTEERLAEVEE